MADEIQSITIPPPTGGWNTKDPISMMEQQYAVEAVNYFPAFGTVDMRAGQTLQCTLTNNGGFGLGTFKYGTTDALLSLGGNPHAISVVPGTSPGTDISGGAATILFTYSQTFQDRVFLKDDFGLGDVYHWTGAGNIALSAFTGPGGDDKLLGPMASYKQRLYFAHRAAFSAGIPRNGNLDLWYAGFQSITGALTQFPLNNVFRLGGYISFIGSVTRAKDFSEDELFAIISSEGEILVYSGNNPAASDWGLIGHYFAPKPCGPKAFFYFGSNLVMITRQGIYGMDSILAGGFGGRPGASILNSSMDENIKSAFVAAVKVADAALAVYEDLIWTGIYYPYGNYLLINIPLTNATSEQYVMNTVTGAWCRFTNQNAYQWAVFQDRLYYSSPANKKIIRADDGFVEESGTRACTLRPAYNYLGERTVNKQFLFATPVMYESQGLNVTIGADVDYQNTAGALNMTDASDVSYRLYQRPIDLSGSRLGKAVSLRFDDTVTTKRRSIQAIDIQYKDAGEVGADII